MSPADRRALLTLARRTLAAFLGSGVRVAPASHAPARRADRAAFVTLWRRDRDELRGCRGEVLARQPLEASVASMAIAAATDDPRFAPVTVDELPRLRIEISALTSLAPIAPDAIVIGRHGLYLTTPNGSGLLLPDVAARHGWDVAAYLRGVCRKAGVAEDAWRDPDATLSGFETESWAENG